MVTAIVVIILFIIEGVEGERRVESRLKLPGCSGRWRETTGEICIVIAATLASKEH